MHERGQPTHKGPGWVAALLAGHMILAVNPGAVGAQLANLGAELKGLGYEQIELRGTGENHLFVFGYVEGRRRSCLVDTGWSLTTLGTNTALRLATPGIVEKLRLGRITLTNTPTEVQDLRVNGQPTAFDVFAAGGIDRRAIPPTNGRHATPRSGRREYDAAGTAGPDLRRET